MRNSKCKIQNLLLSFCIFYFAFCIGACSIPNLESPECGEARESVRQFYSFHFGNDMTPTPENLKQRQRFLTPDLYGKLSGMATTATDYFTNSTDFPRAFKVASCRTVDAGHVEMQVHLFWRYEAGAVQKEVFVNTEEANDKWLIANVTQK